jgi:hypothetical protein
MTDAFAIRALKFESKEQWTPMQRAFRASAICDLDLGRYGQLNCKECPVEGKELALANARLIAAAPDLYEALKVILDTHPDDVPRMLLASSKGLAALARATGQGKERA